MLYHRVICKHSVPIDNDYSITNAEARSSEKVPRVCRASDERKYLYRETVILGMLDMFQSYLALLGSVGRLEVKRYIAVKHET